MSGSLTIFSQDLSKLKKVAYRFQEEYVAVEVQQDSLIRCLFDSVRWYFEEQLEDLET